MEIFGIQGIKIDENTMKKTILFMLFFFTVISTNILGQVPFLLTDNDFEKIPRKHYQFLEGYGPDVNINILSAEDWLDELTNPQSMVKGYWVKIIINNQSKNEDIGLFHNYNTEKIIYTQNSNGIGTTGYWNLKLKDIYGNNNLSHNFKIKLPKDEVSIIYNYFRSKPFNRWFVGNESLDRIYIGSWAEVLKREILSLVIEVLILSILFSVSFYYILLFLVSKDNYLWIALILLFFAIFFMIGRIGMYLDFPEELNGKSEAVVIPLCFAFSCFNLFFKEVLSLKKEYPRIDKLFNLGIFIYFILIPINLTQTGDYPSASRYNDLILYPPDGQGYGVISVFEMLAIWSIFLIISIFISYKTWRKGFSYAGYLCFSFTIPLLIPPIWFIYYLLEMYTWNTQLFILNLSKLLFLSMFITFGLAVAQRMKDFKEFALNFQKNMNDELENKIEERTKELKIVNHEIKKSINAASDIQNSILPNIDLNKFGFSQFDYLWEPRDIVGGDFYWIANKSDWTCFILADCTGHGIPGAFMTLISSTILDRVSSIESLNQPENILNRLDQYLEEALNLNKDKPEQNFGLDAGVCCFSKKYGILRYSGAKMNLHEKKEDILKEYKGDKKSIGYEPKDHPIIFKTYEINKIEDSCFYLFSDGLTDQIGGQKKIMYGKKRILKQIEINPDVSSTIKEVTKEFRNYQENQKRRDDLSFFGFSIA